MKPFLGWEDFPGRLYFVPSESRREGMTGEIQAMGQLAPKTSRMFSTQVFL